MLSSKCLNVVTILKANNHSVVKIGHEPTVSISDESSEPLIIDSDSEEHIPLKRIMKPRLKRVAKVKVNPIIQTTQTNTGGVISVEVLPSSNTSILKLNTKKVVKGVGSKKLKINESEHNITVESNLITKTKQPKRKTPSYLTIPEGYVIPKIPKKT